MTECKGPNCQTTAGCVCGKLPYASLGLQRHVADAFAQVNAQSARIVALEMERDRLRVGLSSIVNFQSPLTRSQVREAAADILRECALKVEPQENQSPLAARIAALTERNAALEKELAEAKFSYCRRDKDSRCSNPDICSRCQPFEGQIAALQSTLATITAECDKAVKDERAACADSGFYAVMNAHHRIAEPTDLASFVRSVIRARATLDGIREAGKDNG